MSEVVYVMLGVIVLAVVFVAWLMTRNEKKRDIPEYDYSLRRPAVIQKLLAPLTFEEHEPTARKASGIFVVMKPELVEQLAIIAKDRRVSKSALCRELILRGLETVVNENANQSVRG